ncbi:M17 family peptidase N-terminal domain-containing protein [Thermodesulfobacteriota bacterium]
MDLNLFFSPYPLGTIKCRVILVFNFEDAPGKPEEKWGFNSRTARYLRSLWQSKFWTGSKGETLLVASKDLGSAEWILLMGLGNRTSFNNKILEDSLRESGKILGKLGITDIGTFIPSMDDNDENYPNYFEESLLIMINAFLSEYKDSLDVCFRIVASIEQKILKKMKSIAVSLEGKLDEIEAFNIEFQNNENSLSAAQI